jgi:prepilin-type processing-associated H-X9-DG protein
MMLCDSYPGWLVYCRVCWPNGPRAGEETNRVPAPPSWAPRHNDGANVTFCDGHTKWQKVNTLLEIPAVGTQQRYDFEILWGHRLR